MILDLMPAAAAREQAVRALYERVTASLSLPEPFVSAAAAAEGLALADLALLRRELMRGDALGAVCAAVNQRALGASRSGAPGLWLLRQGCGWSGDAMARLEIEELRGAALAASFVDRNDEGTTVRAVGVDGSTFRAPIDDALWSNPLGIVAGRASVALDIHSPLAHELIATKPGHSLLDDVSAAALHQKVMAAMVLLRTTWPEMGDAVGASVGLLVVSTTSVRRGETAVREGASEIGFPGVIFMNDYHCPQISIEELAENLIHEAVHHVIMDHELIEPWYDPAAIEPVRSLLFPSPWTGRMLSFYSVFHSLFVFTAIGEWCRRAEASDAVSDATRDYCRDRLGELTSSFAAIAADRARYGLADPPLAPKGRAWLAAHIDSREHWSRGRAAVVRT